MANRPIPKDMEEKMMAMASKVTTVNLASIQKHENRPPDVLTIEDCTVVKVLDIKTPNPLNSRKPWWVESKKSKDHLAAVAAALFDVERAIRDELAKGCTVRMVRGSAGKLADDALPGALKHVRDGIAVWLLGGKPGEMDDDERISWEYGQCKAQHGHQFVVINIKKRK